ITIEEYREAYDSIIEQLRKSFGNRLSDDILKSFQPKNRALEQLISRRLLLQEAEKLQFSVSEDELSNSIKNIPAFQIAGIFNNRLYQRVLNSNRLTPEMFEHSQKMSILTKKLRFLLEDSVKVSNAEARDWYKWNKTSVKIDYLLFEPGRYKDIQIAADEINTFFDRHKESYKTEAKMKVRYLHFDPEEYRPDIAITDEEISEYYESNTAEFKKPKTVEARHILLKVDQGAAQETVDEKKGKILNILKKAREGEDFAQLAKTYSEGPTRDTGGYLGAFQKEAMVRPFAEKAFSMKAGEISEPVRTRFGWHLIKVEKVNEASTLSRKEAEDDIREKLTDKRAKALASDEAETVADALFDGDDLAKAAEGHKAKVMATDFFTKKGPKKDIQNPEKFAAAAFDLTVMDVSDILEFDNGYYILQVIEQIPEQIPQLAEVAEEVKADLIKEKRDKKARQDAKEALKELKNGKTMDEVSKKFNLKPGSTGLFKRTESIPNIGYEPTIAATAFKLSAKNSIGENEIEGTKGYYLIKFADRQLPDLNHFDLEAKKIKASILRQKRLKTVSVWLSQVRKRSDISIENDFVR
ncbi:MAG: peptidylprolyl isomerase, partial [Desulfobacterales bacterium]